MKFIKLTALALLATGSTVAIAQAATTDAPPKPGLLQHITQDLQQSGLRNVEVMPSSFVVKGNDSAGNPVSMYITPDSMTAVSEVTDRTDGTSNPDSARPQATEVADMHQTESTNGAFRTIPSGDELGTQVIGLDVHNSDKKSIGTIKDIAMDQSGHVNGYVLSVGGFLGIDEHNVAVSPSAVNLTWNNHDRRWSAEMNTTAAQLKAAPEYKYSS